MNPFTLTTTLSGTVVDTSGPSMVIGGTLRSTTSAVHLRTSILSKTTLTTSSKGAEQRDSPASLAPADTPASPAPAVEASLTLDLGSDDPSGLASSPEFKAAILTAIKASLPRDHTLKVEIISIAMTPKRRRLNDRRLWGHLQLVVRFRVVVPVGTAVDVESLRESIGGSNFANSLAAELEKECRKQGMQVEVRSVGAEASIAKPDENFETKGMSLEDHSALVVGVEEPTWIAGAWGSCSAGCGEGTRTRPVFCSSERGDCDPNAKPLNEEPCTGGCELFVVIGASTFLCLLFVACRWRRECRRRLRGYHQVPPKEISKDAFPEEDNHKLEPLPTQHGRGAEKEGSRCASHPANSPWRPNSPDDIPDSPRRVPPSAATATSHSSSSANQSREKISSTSPDPKVGSSTQQQFSKRAAIQALEEALNSNLSAPSAPSKHAVIGQLRQSLDKELPAKGTSTPSTQCEDDTKPFRAGKPFASSEKEPQSPIKGALTQCDDETSSGRQSHSISTKSEEDHSLPSDRRSFPQTASDSSLTSDFMLRQEPKSRNVKNQSVPSERFAEVELDFPDMLDVPEDEGCRREDVQHMGLGRCPSQLPIPGDDSDICSSHDGRLCPGSKNSSKVCLSFDSTLDSAFVPDELPVANDEERGAPSSNVIFDLVVPAELGIPDDEEGGRGDYFSLDLRSPGAKSGASPGGRVCDAFADAEDWQAGGFFDDNAPRKALPLPDLYPGEFMFVEDDQDSSEPPFFLPPPQEPGELNEEPNRTDPCGSVGMESTCNQGIGLAQTSLPAPENPPNEGVMLPSPDIDRCPRSPVPRRPRHSTGVDASPNAQRVSQSVTSATSEWSDSPGLDTMPDDLESIPDDDSSGNQLPDSTARRVNLHGRSRSRSKESSQGLSGCVIVDLDRESTMQSAQDFQVIDLDGNSSYVASRRPSRTSQARSSSKDSATSRRSFQIEGLHQYSIPENDNLRIEESLGRMPRMFCDDEAPDGDKAYIYSAQNVASVGREKSRSEVSEGWMPDEISIPDDEEMGKDAVETSGAGAVALVRRGGSKESTSSGLRFSRAVPDDISIPDDEDCGLDCATSTSPGGVDVHLVDL